MNKCTRIVAAIAAALGVAVGGSALAQIKVGITVSASGPGAALGQPQMRTVQALPKEIAGQKVTYVALDDESDPTKAAQNARKLIADEKVDVLIGSSLTPTSLPLIDIAHETKTPLMTLAAAAVLVTPLDDKKRWVFKIVPNDDLMALAILEHIAKTGVKTLGYIGVSDGYGQGYYKALSEAAPKLGITLGSHEVYARSDSSVTGQVLKIIANKPDAVFIASAGTPAVLPQKALRERGYKGPIFQTHGIATEQFIKLGGKDVEGAVFAGESFTIAHDLPASSPFRKPTEEYIKAYRAANGGESPNLFGAHLWDMIVLLGRAAPNALKAAKPGSAEFRAALRDELERGKDVYLNNGLSNMTATDHNGYDKRSAFLIKVEGGAFRLLK
ncbi:MAG: ABC transporter substrate-binding protein [Burkholderiales bacterium]|nr:MAG: ABC transporter substrate-binding protein [Burkholderiales bacterium]